MSEQRFDVIVDIEALKQANPAVWTATNLAWEQMYSLKNSQAMRDVWTRAFNFHLLPYILGGTTANPRALTN